MVKFMRGSQPHTYREEETRTPGQEGISSRYRKLTDAIAPRNHISLLGDLPPHCDTCGASPSARSTAVHGSSGNPCRRRDVSTPGSEPGLSLFARQGGGQGRHVRPRHWRDAFFSRGEGSLCDAEFSFAASAAMGVLVVRKRSVCVRKIGLLRSEAKPGRDWWTCGSPQLFPGEGLFFPAGDVRQCMIELLSSSSNA